MVCNQDHILEHLTSLKFAWLTKIVNNSLTRHRVKLLPEIITKIERMDVRH